MFNLVAARTSRFFFSGPPALYWCLGLLICRCRPWHFPLLSFMRFPSAHFSSLWRFFWMLVQHTVFSVTHPSFVSSARHLNFLCGELPKVLSERVTYTATRNELLFWTTCYLYWLCWKPNDQLLGTRYWTSIQLNLSKINLGLVILPLFL